MGISNLSSEILNAKIDILNGGTSVTGFPKTLAITNQDLNFNPVFWDTESDVSIGGEKRSNIRGYDLIISLNYNVSLEQSVVKAIFDEFPNLVDNANYDMHFYPDSSGTDFVEMIPTGNTGLVISYSSTVKVGGSTGVIPTMEFESRNYRDTIDAFFQT